jgi:spore germination protein PE
MFQRTAVVNDVNIHTVSISSVFQIGDSKLIQGYSRALAVQREAEIFYGNEGNFAEFPIFSEPLLLPAISEEVHMSQQNLNPFIKIEKINIIGVSSSAIVHLGNTKHVSLEARVKHIRQLLPQD